MKDADPFDPELWQMDTDPVQAPTVAKRQPGGPCRKDPFLKGPVPWPWLLQAMKLPGKALAIGLMLWFKRGLTGRRTVRFCQASAAAEGIPTITARRAIRELERAGLVTIERRPGRGLEVTILDRPMDLHQVDAQRQSEIGGVWETPCRNE